MNARPSFDALIYLIKFLMETESCSLEEAIEKAKVPPEMTTWVRTYFSSQVEIVSPAVLEAHPAKGIEYCKDPETGNAEHFHSSFRAFLLNQRKWSRSAAESLDKNSAEILKRLPDPRKNESFGSRGLVIGHIQSGKTANMAALIAKAADRGYKFFIILSGLYNDLRAQTQKRLDQEITGFSETASDYPCVVHPPGALKCIRLTQSGLANDFKAPAFSDLSSETIKFAMVKKNVRVLTSLTDWLGRSPVALKDLPALIIDDEADQATINSKYGKVDDDGNPIDPSATNQRIRDLVRMFPKCSYVGFTATPFANLLIDKDVAEDLYPKDFIVSLPEPPGYLGPRQLFGLGLTPTELSPESVETPSLDVIREITPQDLQDISTLDSSSEIPDVIEKAILSYLLASCARMERGQEEQHFSMFIHPSYITARQETMKAVVSSYLEQNLRTFVIGGEKRFPEFHRRAKSLWEQDFINVTRSQSDGDRKVMEFATIWKHAPGIVDAIEVKSLNYQSIDTTDFTPNHPRRYIVIGGNRLSRGLTIEGLSTSVFLRDTPYYDTLLQMGRWFGYRPGYDDLTRIFVEESIGDNFSDLARVEHELREDLKKYSQSNPPITPLDLAPVIRDHHDMYVTARTKMGAATSVTPWLSGKLKQTVTFPTDNVHKVKENILKSKEFLARLGKPGKTSPGYHGWMDVQSQQIMRFIQEYNFGDALDINSAALLSFIAKMNEHGELRKWDVFLPAGSKTDFDWGSGIKTKTVHRSPVTRKSIGVLSSTSDVTRWKQDLGRDGNDPDRGCLLLYAIDGTHKNASGLNFFASDEKPDIVGLVMIFPQSARVTAAMYVSQDFQ